MTLVKTATPVTYSAVGDIISYKYNVTNIGNIALTGPFTVTDDKTTVTVPSLVSLAPGESFEATASYTITQSDLNSGSVTNTAFASNGTVTSNEDNETVTAVQSPGLTLVKTATPVTYSAVGDIISYKYNVTNIGNIALTGPFTVTDDKTTVTVPSLVSLAPGESFEATASYTITQSDLNSGSVTNTAFASNGTVTSNEDNETVTAERAPAYIIDKIVIDVDGNGPSGEVTEAGDVISYQINVTNVGNIDLMNVSVNDTIISSLSGPLESLNADGVLEVGEKWTYTGNYTVKASDIDSNGGGDGFVNNTATVDCDLLGPKSDSEAVPIRILVPSIDIEKYVWDGSGWVDADTASGPSISSGPVKFKIVVTNNGEVPLTGVNVTDDRYGPVTLNTTTLAVGASAEAEYNMSWASGQQVNTATASGNYGGKKYTDTDSAYYYGPASYKAQYDNRLRESSSCVVYSTATYLDVGKNVSRSRDVLWFDLSMFNKTDTVSKATLSLFWYYPEGAIRKNDTVVDIYRPISWDPKYVTWYYISQSKKWPIVGGTWYDKNNVSQGSTPYGSVTFPAGKVPDNKYYEFDVTQLVQEYINGKYKNTGFFLKARTESGNYIAFYSSDWTNPDQRPKLIVSLASAPAPTIVAPIAPVDEAPVAEAGDDQTVTTGSTVNFDGSGSTDDNGIVLYSWDFGDGTTSTGVSSQHAYTTAGTYTMTLNVTDVSDQSDSDTMQVVVNDPSSAITPTGCTSPAVVADNRLRQISPSTVYATTTYIDVGKGASTSRDVMLFDLSAYEPNTISKATLSLYWYYENPRTSDTVVEIYRPAEEWDPKYVSWNNRVSGVPWTTAGGDWFDKNNDPQGSTPYASVTFPKGTAPDNRYYEFDVTQLVQEYTDGTYKNTGFFLKARTESGNYIAFYSSDYSKEAMRPKLTVCVNGASAPTTPVAPTVPVDEAPVAEAGANQTVVIGSTVSFDGSGSIDANGIVLYSWDFGDGATAEDTVATASHVYPTAGTYTVTLNVTDASDQSDSDTLKVVVSDPVGPVDNTPVANAGDDQTVTTGSTVSFDGSGSTDDNGIVLYSWDFDDSTTSTGVSPQHAYATAGTYTVNLTVTDTIGQKDSDTMQVVVTEPTTPTGSASAVGVADNRLRQKTPTTVFSTTTYIDVGKSENSTSRDVMLFDLSSYKTTDTISKATLSLYWYYAASGRTSDTIADIYRPAVEWDTKYVSWNNLASGKLWTAAGGDWFDKNGDPQGSVPYATVTFPKGMSPDNKYYEFDVTDLVQAYIRGDYDNTGFFLKARTESGNYIAFYSLDYPDPAMRPKLTITR
ncbi:disaggregatase related repeat-containing protein [uncultured Methanomethylovorans sp.]|uniref:disaggregatase related repeat-containing protein n=1 Tax=uncultured Methanomethylovorans sp. TaxID=183759 RepID=UPI002AA82805|nr:disaggregatase related repeat-containing protein [uncultured Methanomethylovorans sp.]